MRRLQIPHEAYVVSAHQRLDFAEGANFARLRTPPFFKKIVITESYGEPLADADGIIRIGVIPFMLDESLLKRI